VRAGLAGKCSLEQVQVDSVAETINEIFLKAIPIYMIQDADKKVRFICKYISGSDKNVSRKTQLFV